MTDRLRRLLLPAMLMAALALRIPGVLWELPNSAWRVQGPDGQTVTIGHSFSYHPDELPVIGAASTVQPAAGQWNPKFYNYGTLQVYLMAPLVAVGRQADGSLNLWTITLLGRLMTALFAVGAVAVIWCAGKRVGGFPGAVAAASFLAVAPLMVQQSQFVTVDVPAVFWVALVLLLTLRQRPALGGLAAGLAAATKYTAGLSLAMPLLALIGRGSPASRFKAAGLTVLGAAAGFLAGCPGVVLWPRDFASGFFFELAHSHAGHGLVFVGTGPGWLYHLVHSLLPGLGWPLAALVAAAVAVTAWKGRPAERSVLGYAVLLFVALAGAKVRFARYTLLLYPAFAVMIAVLMREVPSRLSRVLTAYAIVLGLVYALVLQSPLSSGDPRSEAAIWLARNAPANSSIAFPTVPWFYSPPLATDFGALPADTRRQSAERCQRFRLLCPEHEWDSGILAAKPRYVVISNFEAQDRRRLGDAAYRSFMADVQSRFVLRRSFGGDPPVRVFSLVRSLPHDMQYTSPRIEIYERHD